jgi:hypothetical protein
VEGLQLPSPDLFRVWLLESERACPNGLNARETFDGHRRGAAAGA